MAKLFLFNFLPVAGNKFRAEFFVELTPEQMADLFLQMGLLDNSVDVTPGPKVRNLP